MNIESPEKHGFHPGRLNRINRLMERYIDQGKMAGMVTLVARHGQVVHFETHGQADTSSQKQMSADTIFRIFSMTKPITGAALMVCHEEGWFNVVDPVSKYIPEFADVMVYLRDGYVTDPDRPMTIQDLYRHTSGLTYGGLFGAHDVDNMYSEANIGDPDRTTQEFAQDIAKMPLRYQPGEKWHYSMGMDVLGALIEVFSGQRFSDFLQERIFDPLGMVDTSFTILPEKEGRLATLYQVGKTNPLEKVEASWDRYKNIKFESGGGGLLSTVPDYYRFAQCLLNGGVLDGERILGRKSVELMRSNALEPHQMPVAFEGSESFAGFGYGVCVKVMQDPAAGGWMGSVGDFGWGGYAETYHIIDPAEEMVSIMMMQCIPSMHYPIRKEFRTAVYQALED